MNIAYIAGLVDGEGSIGFTKSRSAMVPRISITNTNLELFESIKNEFGGWINNLSKRKKAWKQGYSWILANQAAVEFVEKVEPWLRLKREQCWLLYAWETIRPGSGKKWDNESIETLDLLNRQSKWLNHRGSDRESISPIDNELMKFCRSQKVMFHE